MIPLAGVGLAYGLWWVSDRLLYIGPLDRASFGWLVVVPIWALTPFAAAFSWRRFDGRQSGTVAGVVGTVLAVAVAARFWAASAFPDCQFGSAYTAADWILPSVAFGLVVGGGFAVICLVGARLLRNGRAWWALGVSAASSFALVFVAVLIPFFFIWPGGVCNPPWAS